MVKVEKIFDGKCFVIVRFIVGICCCGKIYVEDNVLVEELL